MKINFSNIYKIEEFFVVFDNFQKKIPVVIRKIQEFSLAQHLENGLKTHHQ